MKPPLAGSDSVMITFVGQEYGIASRRGGRVAFVTMLSYKPNAVFPGILMLFPKLVASDSLV